MSRLVSVSCVVRLGQAAAFCFTLSAAAQAATYYWDGNGTSWNTAADWSTTSGSITASAVVPGATDLVTFNTSILDTAQTLTLDASQSVSGITFASTSAVTINPGTSGTLTLGAGGVTLIAGAGLDSITAPMTLTGGEAWTAAASTTLTVTGAVTHNVGSTVDFSTTGTFNGTGWTTALTSVQGWATYGSGTSLQFATISSSNVAGLTGTSAATAANVTDTTGAVNYDLAAVGTLGSGASFNTLRYLSTGAAGTIAGAFTANGLMNDGGALIFSSAATIGANKELVITGPGNITFSAAIGNNGANASALTYSGTGVLTLNATNGYTGATTVNSGRIVLTNNKPASASIVIGSGAFLEYADSAGVVQSGTTYTGAGTLVMSGVGGLQFGAAGTVNVNFSAGAVIDVEGGTLTASSSNQANWASNKASLNIASSATVNTVEAGGSGSPFPTFKIDALTGAGTFQGGYSAQGISTAQIGVANGSGTFSGIVKDNTGVGTLAINKIGTGTQVFGGANTYTGGTTVSGGALVMTKPTSLGNGFLNIGGNSFAYEPTAAGALNIGSGVLTLANGSVIGTGLGGTASQSAITSTGAASLSGTGTVNIYGIPNVTPALGVNNLITAGSGLAGGTYTLGNAYLYNPTNYTIGSFTPSATAISVTVSSATALTGEFWKGGLSGGANVWALSNGTTASNWASDQTGTATPLTPGSGATITFSANSATSQSAMVLGANMSVAGIVINDTTALALNADGNSLTLGTGGITINTTSGNPNVTLAVPIILGGPQTWQNDSSNPLVVSGAVTNGANLLTVQGAGNTTIGGVIGNGAGGLTKAGAGTLTLTGANSYGGTTTISAGTLQIGNGGTTGSLSTGAIVDNGSLVYNLVGTSTTATLPAAGITGSGALAVTADTIVLNGNVTTAGNQSYTATTAGANNHGIKILGSPGTTLTATGGASITMSGDVGFTNGSAGGALTLDTSSGNGTINLNISNGRSNSLFQVNSITVNAGTGAINVTGAGNAGGWNAAPVSLTGALNITGNVGSSGTAPVTITSTAAGSVSGTLSGTMSLTKQGAAALTLTHANTYTGGTIVSAGTLNLNATSALAASSLLTINNGGTVSLQAANNSINSLGTITINAGGILSADAGAGQAHTVSNLIQLNGGSLAGNSNFSTTFGQFFMSGANANIDAANNTQSTISAVLGLDNSLHGLNNITVENGASLLISGKLIGVSNSSWGGFAKLGPGTLTLTNSGNNYGHGMTLSAGTVVFSHNSLSLHNASEGVAGYAADFEGNATLQWASGNTDDLSTSGNLKIGDGFNATLNTNGNTVTLGTALVVGTNSSGALIVNDTAASPGILKLSAANSYTGGTTISAGTLQLSGSGTFGNTSAPLTINGGALDLNNTSQGVGNLTGAGGTLRNNGNGAATLTIGNGNNGGGNYLGVIADNSNAGTGTVALTKTGSGTIALGGINTYTGATNVNVGKLVLGATGGLGNTAITVPTGGTFSAQPGVGSIAAGSTATASAGAKLMLSPGASSNAGGSLDMIDGAIGTFNLQQGSSFGAGVVLGGSGTAANAPNLSFEIANNSLGSADKLAVTNGVTVNSGTGLTGAAISIVPITGATSLALGDYTIITAASGLGAGFTLNTPTLSVGGHAYSVSLADSTSIAEVITIGNATPFPVAAYWNGSQSATWNTLNGAGPSTNWSTAATAGSDTNQIPGPQTDVYFTVASGATNLTTTLGQTFAINSLNFTGNASPISISSGTLVLNAAATANNTAGVGITIASGSGAVTIASAVTLGSTQSWTNSSLNSLVVSGPIGDGSDGFGVTIAGTGPVTFSGNNTYSGPTIISAGSTLNFNSTTAAGASAITLNSGATIDNTTAGSITNANVNAVTWGGDFTFGGTKTLNLGTGAVTASQASHTITLNGSSSSLTFGGTVTNAGGAAQTLTVNGTGNTLTLGGYALSNNGTNRTDVINGSGNVTISGAVTNGGTATASGLTYSGSGTLTLSGASTYAGTTTVGSGKVVINGAISPSSPVAVNSGATLSLVGNNATGNSGGGTAGPWTITGGTVSADTTGTTTEVINGNLNLNGGTLATSNATANSTFGNFFFYNNGAQVVVTGTNRSTISAVLGLSNNHTFNVADVTSGVDLTVSGRIYGNSGTFSGEIIKTGAGTLYLSNALNGTNPSGGLCLTGVQLNAGEVLFVNGGLGNGVSFGGGPVPYIADFTGASTLTWATGNTQDITASSLTKIEDGVTATLNTNGNNVTLGTAIVLGTNKTGALQVNDTAGSPGVLTLGAANTFTGGATVSGGTLRYGIANALATTGAINVNGSSAILDLGGFSSTSGAVTLTNGTIQNGTLAGSSYAVQNGAVSASLGGAGGLTKSTSGTVILSAANGYSGATAVNSGVLEIASPGSLASLPVTVASTGVLTVDAGASLAAGTNLTANGTVNLNNTTQTIATLNGASTGIVNLNNNTLTVTGGGTYSGAIVDPVGALTVSGGALTLGGTNTYTGSTTITGGTLRITGGGSIGSSGVINLNGGSLDVSTVTAPPFVVGPSQSLKGAGTVLGAVTVNGTIAPGQTNNVATATASTLTLGSGSSLLGSALLDLIANTGSADQIAYSAGAGTATLGGTLTVTNPNAIAFAAGQSYDLFNFNANTESGTFSTVNLPSLGTSTLAWNTANLYTTGVVSIVTAGPPLGSGVWTNGAGGQTWTNANNWMIGQPSGATYVATFDATGYTATNPNPVLLGMAGQIVGGLAFNTSAATGYTIGGGGSDGPLTLNNNGNSAATITVNGGDQTIAANVVVAETTGATLSAVSGASLSITGAINNSGYAMTVSGAGNTTLFGALSGSGSLTMSGTGMLTLGHSNAGYSGLTTVSSGSLRTGTNVDNALGTGALVDNAAVNLGGNENIGTLSGSGSISVASTKTLTVTQGIDESLNGSLTLGTTGAGGTLTLSATNTKKLTLTGSTTLNTGNAIAVNGGTLNFNLGNTSTPVVGANVTAMVASGATLELTGTVSALADPTALSSGTDTHPTQRVAVQNEGTLEIDGGTTMTQATQQVGGIDGAGSVTVADYSGLTADHINQTSLVIGNGSVFTLAPSDSNGNPMASGLVLAGSLAPASSFIASSGSLLGAGNAATIVSAVSLGGVDNTSISAVPEPATMALLLFGVLAAAPMLRRRPRGRN